MKSLIRREAPQESIVGIILAAASLIVMPLLVRAKRRVARGIKSAALMADSKQTELLHLPFGYSACGLLVPIIVKDGIEGLRGETCCDDECH